MATTTEFHVGPLGRDDVRPARDARLHRVWRGRPQDPAWARPALCALLAVTALLYLWDLGASGNANEFYAAAVQAGSENWKAWFFGSIDTSNFITVDKPPASLWVMGLSGRLFGYSSWSMLVPQALEGVAAVAVLHATVRRVAGPRAGLVAGGCLALTPAAVLMFRFDNPDALLLLLVVTATYCVTRALEHGRMRWLVWAGVALGFAFLTKSAQSLLVLPALSLAYLVAAPITLRRRLGHLVVAGATMVGAAGWWFLTVLLWPASDRPYIGGSTDNNPLELAFGYNGLSRLFGGSGNGGGGGGGGGLGGNTSFGGATGLQRMFTGEFALEISWLLPAALVGLIALCWLAARGPRTDPLRAAVIVWGGSLLVTGLTFSFMQGTIHPYYSVALAPSIGALVGLSIDRLLVRGTGVAKLALAAIVVAGAGWGVALLRREGGRVPLEIVAVVAAVAALLLLAWRGRRAAVGLVLALAIAVGAPTAVWARDTAATPHNGSIPTAVSSSGAGSGSGGFGGGMGSTGGDTTTDAALVTALQAATTTWAAATVGATGAASLELSSDTAVMAIGGFSGSDEAPTLVQFEAMVAAGDITYFVVSDGASGAGGGGQPTAATGAQTSGEAPSGGAPSGEAPTGGGGAMGGGSGSSSEITTWVEANYTATTIGGTTVYDLTAG